MKVKSLTVALACAVVACASVPQLSQPLGTDRERVVAGTTIRVKQARAAIMLHGFRMAPNWASSGFSVDIPVGAVGIPFDGGACYANTGSNAAMSKTRSNFCFYDADKTGRYTEAQLDSGNGHGRFRIEPVEYVVDTVPLGFGAIVSGHAAADLPRGSATPREVYAGLPCAALAVEAYRIAGRLNEIQAHQVMANRGEAGAGILKLMIFAPASAIAGEDPLRRETAWLTAARDLLARRTGADAECAKESRVIGASR